MSLFDTPDTPDTPETPHKRPLAERLRPKSLDDFIGQEHILGKGKPLRRAIESDHLSSLILWGPPASARRRSRQSSPKPPKPNSSPSPPSSPA